MLSTSCELCSEGAYKGILFCKNCFKNRKLDINDAEINKISEKVYLGNEEGAMDILKLKELKITHILICGADLIKFHEKEFIYKQIEIEDEAYENLLKYVKIAINFIESSKKIYVHCWAGVSRSASFVIAYFMWKHKLSLDEAVEFVKKGRDCINPNEGFLNQLKLFEIFLHKNEYKLKYLNK